MISRVVKADVEATDDLEDTLLESGYDCEYAAKQGEEEEEDAAAS